jgi:HD-like signal output (HDOD) protein
MSQREGIVLALASVVSNGDFKVPAYPAVALRLQKLLAGDRYSTTEVSAVIAADAALAATVLAAANSAALGVGPPITKLNEAVNRLGARTVGAIAVASGVSAAAVTAGMLLDVKFRVWRRTMIGALACQKLAVARRLAPEAAFLSGLLHGFGRSIAVAAIEQLLRTQKSPVALSVEEWLGIAEEQRAPLARALSSAWKLPQAIAEAIDDKARGASPLNDLVIDADSIASELEAGRTPVAVCPAESRHVDELLASLPASLDAFSSAAGAASKVTTSASAAVTKPDHVLEGELRRAKLPVADRRAKAPATLTCLAVSRLGIELESSKRFQECAVVRLAVGEADGDLEPWFTVVLCVAEGSRYRAEFQLFSPPRDVREKWLALYESLEHEANTSALQRVAGEAPVSPASAGGSGR